MVPSDDSVVDTSAGQLVAMVPSDVSVVDTPADTLVASVPDPPVAPAPTDPRMVTSLRDIFQWPRAYLDTLSELDVTDADICNKFTELGTWSDAFAGVSCDVVALNMIDAELLRRRQWMRDDHQPLLTHCWAIEWDTQCVYEQKSLPHGGPSCIFGNILDFATPTLRQELASLKASGAELADYVQACSQRNAVTCAAECRVHGRRCTATMTGGHCSGCPCTDLTL